MYTILYTHFAQIDTLTDWNNLISPIIALIAVIVAILAMRKASQKESSNIINSKVGMTVFNQYKIDHEKEHIKMDQEIKDRMTYKEIKPYLEMIKFLYEKAL